LNFDSPSLLSFGRCARPTSKPPRYSERAFRSRGRHLKKCLSYLPFVMNFMPNFALQPTIKNLSEVIHAAVLRRKDPSYSYTCTINTRQIIVSAKKKGRTWFAAAIDKRQLSAPG
jgi:hypothetical protein